MSTRSVITAYDIRDGLFGRYCHNDGYPDHNGVELHRILREFGYDAAVNELIIKSGDGWSFLSNREDLKSRGDRETLVPGYGLRFTDRPTADHWMGLGEQNYGYILYPDRIDVIQGTGMLGRIWIADPTFRLASVDSYPPPPPISWKAKDHA